MDLIAKIKEKERRRRNNQKMKRIMKIGGVNKNVKVEYKKIKKTISKNE